MASLTTNILNVVNRVSTEIRSLRAMMTGSSTGDLTSLATTNKSSLVAAINEAASAGGAATLDELGDVAIANPAGGHILRHNGTAFVNGPGTDFYDPAGAAAVAEANAKAASQPVDPDLTAIAGISTQAFGRALLALVDQAALTAQIAAASDTVSGRVELATPQEAIDGVDAARAVTPAGVSAAINALVSGAPGLLNTLDELAQALGDDPNFATTISNQLAGKQPLDPDLTAIAGLASATDKMPYATGPNAWALTTLSAFARTLLDDANAADARTTLSVYSQSDIGDVNTDFVAAFNTALTA